MKIALFSLIMFLGLVLMYMGINEQRGNFHEVVVGHLYRSAQPTLADMSSIKSRYGIRTIINLRNDQSPASFLAEQQAANALGIQFIHFPIESSTPLPVHESARLASLMESAEEPILIHCEHGANRTGLASAIYLKSVLKQSSWISSLQLTPYYNHIPIPGLGRYEMYRSWDHYEDAYAS